ncbi:chromate transporter [Solimicrobium silvestre]|uniref:Chromate transport protein ChrA n=1 Tax=Solimicrobium silvestre TaxID=2099400 RepID=A0A2S9GWU8_9BURK|nr:chromate transporter [Solimicrobium silvestre]PRC92194.1 Chromate transport protein ChrA [Solimicrobium silvestre]
MQPALQISLNWSDWLDLFQHYFMLSMLSIGGAISTLPEMHRFLVEQHHWLTETQFNASIAIGQASPGPNLLFIALLAWNVGINSGSVAAGLFSVLIAMVGILVPSTTLTYLVAGWLRNNNGLRPVRAFKQGLAPIVIALLIATGWIMASSHPQGEWHLWLVTIVTAVLIWRTRIHMLWLIGAGALLGWFGFI